MTFWGVGAGGDFTHLSPSSGSDLGRIWKDLGKICEESGKDRIWEGFRKDLGDRGLTISGIDNIDTTETYCFNCKED